MAYVILNRIACDHTCHCKALWISVSGTVCIRLAIFPLVILAQRNAIELQNNMPTMQRLQERMILARRSGDHIGGKFE